MALHNMNVIRLKYTTVLAVPSVSALRLNNKEHQAARSVCHYCMLSKSGVVKSVLGSQHLKAVIRYNLLHLSGRRARYPG